MTAKGKQWAAGELPLEQIREDTRFQLRAHGIKQREVKRLRRRLDAGETLPRVKVAAIGKAFYLVDGFHRLEAHRLAGRKTIGTDVARMSMEEARSFALLANTTHGLSLSQKDKAAIWEAYVAAGDHLQAPGVKKSARRIEDELNGTYSRETIRKRLRTIDGEMAPDDTPGGGLKPRYGPEDEALLAWERADLAASDLRSFVTAWPSLEPEDQRRLLRAARDMVETLERGEAWGDRLEPAGAGLDL